MPSVKVEMETGRVAVRGDKTPAQKVRKLKRASADTRERLRQLEQRKLEAARKRGAWKDASPESRIEAREIAAEIAEARRALIAEHEAAKAAELEKQAAASRREQARRDG